MDLSTVGEFTAFYAVIKLAEVIGVMARDRRNGRKNGNPGSNPGDGSVQMALGAMGARIEDLCNDSKTHNEASLSVQYETLNAIKTLDTNEEGRHGRMGKKIEALQEKIDADLLTQDVISGKMDTFIAAARR